MFINVFMSPLGMEHGNIKIQLDLWGNEVIFWGKGTNNYTDTRGQTNKRPKSLFLILSASAEGKVRDRRAEPPASPQAQRPPI
jgi:hypothetical protein